MRQEFTVNVLKTRISHGHGLFFSPLWQRLMIKIVLIGKDLLENVPNTLLKIQESQNSLLKIEIFSDSWSVFFNL